MAEYRLLPAGDTALVVEFGDRIDRRLNMSVLALSWHLNEASIEGVIEVVPTFRSLMVHYDPLTLPSAALIRRIEDLLDNLATGEEADRRWRLPVCYDARMAPDLDEIAALTGLSPAQVIERHSGEIYHVYMLGFLPGQAYMGDLPAELALPRRETPRLKIPAGSVAIAMTMTCIFPLETPCGWRLIGRSPIPLWDRRPSSQPLLAPGDKVTFAPISFREFEKLSEQVADGQFKILPVGQELEAAA
jgi:KipI family sensor histidine kinase inhibitor